MASEQNSNSEAPDAAELAERYYDSDDADRFYHAIWGGEDIHVGCYERPDEPIREASRRTVERMAELCSLDPSTKVLDLGAGYGGAARYLASRYGCPVTCLNLSEIQNTRNRELNAAVGLSDRIDVLHASFEDIPRPDGSYDLIWSQDAILHSAQREQTLVEARRVLRRGGSLLFTDPMQSDDCPDGVLKPVLDRIHLSSLGSFAYYRATLARLGFVEKRIINLTPQLIRHYTRVRDELKRRRADLDGRVSSEYIERMTAGLDHWISAGEKGYLAWGILEFRLPPH